MNSKVKSSIHANCWKKHMTNFEIASKSPLKRYADYKLMFFVLNCIRTNKLIQGGWNQCLWRNENPSRVNSTDYIALYCLDIGETGNFQTISF